MIWKPNPPDNKYGHAALHTDKYHISFWPSQCLDKTLRLDALRGKVEASIVFAQEVDYNLENDRMPDFEHQLVGITNEAVNEVYEKVLDCNRIAPSEVTLEKATEIMDEWMALSPEERERLGSCYIHDRLAKKLITTSYSFLDNLPNPSPRSKHLKTGFMSAFNVLRFYHYPQCCTSFCLNIIKKANDETEVEEEERIPSVLTVDSFDSIIRKYYMGSKPSTCTVA